MGHDPWTELKARAEDVRRTIESRLGVRTQGTIEEAPEEKGLFSLATFPYAKELRKPPAEVAAQVAQVGVPAPFASPKAEGGYVNLLAEPGAFAAHVLASVSSMGASYGQSPAVSQRILLEHTSTNPTGPLHVGRARNPILGDALARILKMAGFPVTREYLVNDVGRQMVVQYWGTKHLTPEEVGPPDADKPDYRYIKYYTKASAVFESDPKAKEEVALLIQRFERGDVALTKEIRQVAEDVLQGILQSLARIDVSYDSFFWESDAILNGSVQEVIERLVPLSHEEEGAHYLDLTPFGLEGDAARYVFVRRDGTSLYTTRDIAYHLDKMTRCDVAINVLGEDQKLTFQRLKAAFRLMGVDWAPETIFYAFVSLPEGRMSTRKGRVVNLDDLIDEAVDRARAEVDQRREDLPEPIKREIAELVGIGAVRYNIVRVQAEKRIVFRWEEALNFEGNSAPFLQYAHARACGILDKTGPIGQGDVRLLTDPQEQRLLRWIAKFPSTVRDAAVSRRVHLVASFAADMAAQFNQFYRDCPVLTAEPAALRDARLALVDASRVVLHNALGCLGLKAPREM
ncbi:MAG: arginine--tRNA ligase [Candidatus Thermoplasmatota archaeon]